MATRMQKLLTRAITPQLGNLKKTTYTGGGGKGPRAGTLNVHYHTPGMPQYLNDDEQAWAIRAFQTSVFVMRCIQTISSTIAGLPFMAGLDPFDPGTYDPTAPLAQLLGPSTPQAPGGPNPSTSSRMFWDWSIKQYIAQGRFAWETQLASAGRRAEKLVVALWPLVASYIDAIPTDGGQQMFAAFDYTTATNNVIHLKADEVFYAWKPAMDDWRLPESVLGSIRDAVNIQTGLDRYMSRLLKNDMVARTMVVTPPFDEAAARRAFRDQFRSRFTGVEHAGEIAFAEAERDEEDTTGQPLLQIEKIAQTAVESSLLQISAQAKIDITIAIGVPMSLIGNASQRCVDERTEILTADGWKTHDQLRVGDEALTLNHDTGLAEWQPVEHISRYEVENQPMLHMQGRGIDSVTNAPHRWPVLDKATGARRWTTSQDLTTKHQLITSAPVTDLPVEPKYSDDFVELAAWYWTEGHRETFRPSGNPGCVVITQSEQANPAYCRRIDSVMRSLFGAPVESLRSGGDTAWRTYTQRDGEIRRWKLCTDIAERLERIAPDKAPTVAFIRSLTKAQLELFIDVSLMADGWRTNQGGRVIAQKRSDVLEGLALAVTLSGRTPRRWTDENQGRHYLAISDRDIVGVPPPTKAKRAKATREWKPYTGTIWCPSTGPNASWLARRNGKVLFTGNTYANADSEYKNFWTITVIPMIAEIQEFVNQGLAPRVGQEVGWFDLSRVEALKPPQLFAPPMIGDVINFGVADAAQVANVLGIPAANATTDSDTDTVGIGVESSTGTSISGKREAYRDIERVTKAQMISARLRWEQRPLNTYTVNDPFTIQRWIQRERLPEVRSAAPTSTNSSPQATAILKGIERIQERRAAKAKDAAKIRAAALAERTEALALELRSLARSVENDNAAYHEGIAHRLQSYPMLSEKEYAAEHPDADPDDYPLYMAGFKANEEDDNNEIVSGQRDWAVYDAERLRIGDRVHYQDKIGRTQHAVVAEHRRGPGSVHLVAVKHIHQAGKAHERISDQGAVVDLAELHKSDDEEFTHPSAKATPGYKTHVGVREDQAVLSDLGPELTTWDGSPDSLDSWLSDNDGALEVLANGAGS